jgi:hypothetical protein
MYHHIRKKIMKYSIIILSFILFCNTSAQITFEKYYETLNNSRSNTVLQTSDDHFLMAGHIDVAGSNHDIYLIKTDAYGDTVWTRTYHRQWTETPEVLVETADKNYLLAGHAVTRTGPSANDVLLMKIAPNGDLIWTKTIGVQDDDEQIYDMRPTSDGGYILCGQYDEYYTDIYYYLLKINANGDSLWSTLYNPAEGDRARGRGVVMTDDNKFVIAGYVKRGDVNFAHLAKIDSVGQAVWSQTWNNGESDYLNDIQETADNGYILAGNTFNLGAGYMDYYLIKTDSDGDSIWTRTYGGESSEFCYSIKQTADEGFIMAGYGSSFGHGSLDCYLVRTNLDGDTLWTRSFGGASQDDTYEIKITSDGGFVLTGGTYSFGIGLNSYLVKTDHEGLITSVLDENLTTSRTFHLSQNYPNPFNPKTIIDYELPIKNDVDLSIYNLLGQKVANLVSERQRAGSYQVEWDASFFSSGVYYFKIEAGEFKDVKKMILLR